ncbi:MAG: YpjP family protein [Bacillaceae bacterium]|nr:YpjP family protein [Bacillaceae bacterium]
MRLWLKKVSAVLVTFMTLGMFIPPTYLDAEASEIEEVTHSTTQYSNNHHSELVGNECDVDHKQLFLSHATNQAKHQAMLKFGSKIGLQVEDEFETIILPKIEKVIEVLADSKAEEVMYFSISEKPAGGYGEKIFHIYDTRTSQDVVRFHVSRVKLPKSGYWFNFHYHLASDQYEQHYKLGELFWDTNMPPKWMS